jgi:hypothetical protein
VIAHRCKDRVPEGLRERVHRALMEEDLKKADPPA